MRCKLILYCTCNMTFILLTQMKKNFCQLFGSQRAANEQRQPTAMKALLLKLILASPSYTDSVFGKIEKRNVQQGDLYKQPVHAKQASEIKRQQIVKSKVSRFIVYLPHAATLDYTKLVRQRNFQPSKSIRNTYVYAKLRLMLRQFFVMGQTWRTNFTAKILRFHTMKSSKTLKHTLQKVILFSFSKTLIFINVYV